jgi:hypothetical protein
VIPQLAEQISAPPHISGELLFFSLRMAGSYHAVELQERSKVHRVLDEANEKRFLVPNQPRKDFTRVLV